MNDKKRPLVSVIMGAYNCENTIEKAVQSIQNQTYSNWELIICDDCSTDNTWGVLSNIAKDDERIVLLQNSLNKHLAASLNRCLSKANGEYIARMDADDESLPTRLEKQVCFLNENLEYDCVGSSMLIYDDMGDKYVRKAIEMPNRNYLKRGVPCWHPTIMLRKRVYDLLDGYSVNKNTTRAEDLDFWFRFYAKDYLAYNLREPLYRYHESVEDYKKRTVRAAFQTARVCYRGFKMLGYRGLDYFFVLKPIFAAILPRRIVYRYHSFRKSY